jgi:hypothetical protein
MFKAEAGICCMFFMRDLTLLNTAKNPKFQKSFVFAHGSGPIRRGIGSDRPLRDQSVSDT